MKVFISYSSKDALSYAERAKEILESGGHVGWLWDHSRTVGTLLWEDIFEAVSQSEAMLFLCTDSSRSSWGQRFEMAYAMTERKAILPLRIDSAELPPVLTPFVYANWSAAEFAGKFGSLVTDLQTVLERIKRLDALAVGSILGSDRRNSIAAVNGRTGGLDGARVSEGRQEILKSYLEATVIREVAKVAEERSPAYSQYMSIGLWELTGLGEFNSPSYWWTPYFTDVGRHIARGEQDYLQYILTDAVAAGPDRLSRKDPDFMILEDLVATMSQRSTKPNVILAPFECYVSFLKFFGDRVDWSAASERWPIGGRQIKVVWSNRFARSASYIVYSSSAVVWTVVPDHETGAIQIAIGKSALYPDKVQVGAETTVKCEITDPGTVHRIQLE